MYGLVHEAVHHFVMSLDGGEETFATIVEKSGQRDLLRSHFMYPDEVTLAFIGAACEVWGRQSLFGPCNAKALQRTAANLESGQYPPPNPHTIPP